MKKVISIDLNAQLIYQDLKQQCEELSDQAKALAMKAYMKNLFDFYGINAPNRNELSKTFKKKYKFVLDDHLWQLIEYLWTDAHREMQYIALDLLTQFANKMTTADAAST